MEEIIKQALDKYFSDFKEYHLLILIGFTVVIALFQVIQSLFISTRIERFKTTLKKSEIKFSKYNELQITVLRKIYHQLAALQLSNALLFKTEPNTIGHNTYKKRINEWVKIYIECAGEFNREKILLTPEIKSLFSRTINDFEDVKKILVNERQDLDYLEMENQGIWEAMYEYEENELATITEKLKKIGEKESIKNSEKHIRELRDKIEDLFQQMN